MNKVITNYFNFIKRFIPTKSAAAAIGVDIGTSSCKMVEVAKVGANAYKLDNYAIEPIVSGDIKSSFQKIVQQIKSPEKDIYTAVYSKGTLIRYIKMPIMSEKDLKNSFDIEADKYFPFAQDQIFTDCHIAEQIVKEKQMIVMAAASKKEIVEEKISLIKEVGLNISYVGINSIALINASNLVIQNHEDFKENVVGLLDIGNSVSSLTILINNVPRFSRDIFVGGKDFTKRINNALEMSFVEAEALKLNPGVNLNKVIDACESAIMNIVQELRLSFDYFTTETNKEVNKLYLTGGGCLFQSLPDIFSKNLEIKVERLDILSSIKVSEDLELKKDKLLIDMNFLNVAVGLALYEYD